MRFLTGLVGESGLSMGVVGGAHRRLRGCGEVLRSEWTRRYDFVRHSGRCTVVLHLAAGSVWVVVRDCWFGGSAVEGVEVGAWRTVGRDP
jgi:hypothetical protein